MSVTATVALTLNVSESITGNAPAAISPVISHTAYSIAPTVTGTLCAFWNQALTAGAATVDLTNCVGTNGIAVSGSGLRVKAIQMTAASDNANDITLTEGASNGYELLGSGWTVGLKAGQSLLFYPAATAPQIGSSAKTIDISGTGTQSVKLSIIFGA